jgi:hypothetical protein
VLTKEWWRLSFRVKVRGRRSGGWGCSELNVKLGMMLRTRGRPLGMWPELQLESLSKPEIRRRRDELARYLSQQADIAAAPDGSQPD